MTWQTRSVFWPKSYIIILGPPIKRENYVYTYFSVIWRYQRALKGILLSSKVTWARNYVAFPQFFLPLSKDASHPWCKKKCASNKYFHHGTRGQVHRSWRTEGPLLSSTVNQVRILEYLRLEFEILFHVACNKLKVWQQIFLCDFFVAKMPRYLRGQESARTEGAYKW